MAWTGSQQLSKQKRWLHGIGGFFFFHFATYYWRGNKFHNVSQKEYINRVSEGHVMLTKKTVINQTDDYDDIKKSFQQIDCVNLCTVLLYKSTRYQPLSLKYISVRNQNVG